MRILDVFPDTRPTAAKLSDLKAEGVYLILVREAYEKQCLVLRVDGIESCRLAAFKEHDDALLFAEAYAKVNGDDPDQQEPVKICKKYLRTDEDPRCLNCGAADGSGCKAPEGGFVEAEPVSEKPAGFEACHDPWPAAQLRGRR